MQYMDELDNWSWGGMALAFLYENLSLTSDSYVASCGGYMTLLMVIIVFLIFYLLDRKCIIVCIIHVLIFMFAGMSFRTLQEPPSEES